jgi:hypothetical protein
MKVLAQVGFFLRLDDYRAGYRGSKKGRSVYLFPGLPSRVLLGNLRGFKSIKNNTEHKNNTFASCTGSLNPVGSLY